MSKQTKKPVRVKRKFVLIEFETAWSNQQLEDELRRQIGFRCDVFDLVQIHVNAAKPEKKKA